MMDDLRCSSVCKTCQYGMLKLFGFNHYLISIIDAYYSIFASSDLKDFTIDYTTNIYWIVKKKN